MEESPNVHYPSYFPNKEDKSISSASTGTGKGWGEKERDSALLSLPSPVIWEGEASGSCLIACFISPSHSQIEAGGLLPTCDGTEGAVESRGDVEQDASVAVPSSLASLPPPSFCSPAVSVLKERADFLGLTQRGKPNRCAICSRFC
ncbi:hypothetical protein Naga_100129g6 [Nannochloropsis gaditana]|uniref:Uncharacterized protein n=1 Tax=Nannochloropsis gaditana TaxID=72520 RepID=W7UCU1_9STRA|nr:hypothetical protein Naga_100129g6 [Nannochloropsis gaditana]